MNTIAQLVNKTYLETVEKAEAKVKEDVAHQKRDLELITAALEKLTMKEQRPAMLILFLQYNDHFTEAQHKEMLSYVFDMTSDDLDTLTGKIHNAMNSCSEPQTSKHSIQSLLDRLTGGREAAEEKKRKSEVS